MTRMKKRPFLALLLAMTLAAAVPPPSAGAAERPAASKLANGYLLIGTFLIDKNALSQPLLDVAKASMADSGQGMYYKSEFADGAWCNIKNGVDITALLKGKGIRVPDAEVDKLKLTVWAHMDNGKAKIESLQTEAQLNDQIEQLTVKLASVEEQNKQAVEGQDSAKTQSTALEIVSLQAQIRFLEALKSGDSDQAAAALEDQTAGKPLPLETAVKQTEQQLQAAQQELADAKASGDAASVAQLEDKVQNLAKQVAAQQASLAQQTAEQAVQQVQQQLQDAQKALAAASASGDAASADKLLATVQELSKQLEALVASLVEQPADASFKQLEQQLEQAQQELAAAVASGDAASAAKLEDKVQDLTNQLAAKRNSLAEEVAQAAGEESAAALAELAQAVARSDAKAATEQFAALTAADVKLQAVQAALLQMKQAALTDQRARETDAAQIRALDKQIAEGQQADSQSRKLAIQKQTVALQAMLKKASQLGEQELAGELLVKITANAGELPALREREQQARVALLNLEKTELEAQRQQARAAGDAKALDALRAPIVHVESLLQSEAQGVAAKIADLQEAEAKLNLEIAQANEDGDAQAASDLAQDLRNVQQNIVKKRQEQLLLEKELTERQQAAVQPPSAALAKHHTDVILQILALEKAKYTAGDLAKLDAVGKQVKAALGKSGQLLPVENVYSKDVEIKFQVPAVVINGRTYIHIRPISEAFGATVDWSDAKQTVTINAGDRVVHCTIGTSAAYINDRQVQLDAAPRLIADRTFVPLRFVMDALGLDVQWDEQTESIEIKGIVKP